MSALLRGAAAELRACHSHRCSDCGAPYACNVDHEDREPGICRDCEPDAIYDANRNRVRLSLLSVRDVEISLIPFPHATVYHSNAPRGVAVREPREIEKLAAWIRSSGWLKRAIELADRS